MDMIYSDNQLELFPGQKVSSYDVTLRCADRANLWAYEFCKTAKELGYDIDEGLMIGWFACAIEHSSDVRRWYGEYNPDDIYKWMNTRNIKWPLDEESRVLFTLTWV